MLASLQKTTSLAGSATAGRDVYSSMVVDAVAESVTAGGGIGLAEVIARALMEAPAPRDR